MTAQHLTSVIMVTYHTGPVLETAIEAALNQTAEVELVLVNNGNPPEVEAALVERFKDDPAVRLMTGHGNIGLARGYNLGARVATGSHLLFLSPRCLIAPDTVGALQAQAAPVKGLAAFGVNLVDERNREQPGARSGLLSPESLLIEAFHLTKRFASRRLRLHLERMPDKMTPVPAISGRFMFMKKADYVKAKGFDEGYKTDLADMDFCFRFHLNGGHIYFIPRIKAILTSKAQKGTSVAAEQDERRDLIRYLHENYSDKYFQPFLWMFYGLIWLRARLRPYLVR